MTSKQLESTYAELHRVIGRLQRSVRAENIHYEEEDFLADTFAQQEDENFRNYHLHNQAAYNAAHPILASRNRKKVGASSKTSKIAKEATINELLMDSEMDDEEIIRLVRRAFANKDSLQLQWKTESATYHPEVNLFRICLDISFTLV